MSSSSQFLQAAEAVQQLSTKPDNDTLLKLYGLYKQATIGDNNTNKPGMLDLKGNAKWNNWNNYKGYSKYKAEVEYIKLVNKLITEDDN
jgi:diazepam-binding inhibitor (GABA receptor modulating acyl-CoA-binding protein)